MICVLNTVYLGEKGKVVFWFLCNKFLLGHIHYKGEFVATILARLMLYIIYIASIVSPPQPPPHPT
jgi:hypothetical protein